MNSPLENLRGAFLSANSPNSRSAACAATGSENYGGPLVTSGGLLFIAATIHDRKFRAFDKANGKLLWETLLPFSADANPITYQVDGRQYVAIFASGGKERSGSGGGVYLAYALPGEVELRRLSRADEVQRYRVHAITQPGGVRPVVEHVPEVRIAELAVRLGGS